MKKNSIFALMSAIALSGTIGFSSCSSSYDEVITNPDYNPEENSVKTEFAISLPNYVGSATRQSDIITQAQEDPVFRGMQDLVLIPYDAAVTSESTPWKSKIFNSLGTIAATSGWDQASQKAKVYKTLDVPVGTKVFMFYGQAITNGTNFNNGALNPPTSYAGAASAYGFTLQTIAGDYVNTSDVKGTAIVSYIQSIRGTAGLSSTTLGSLLTNFKPTAASSASIQAAVQALWDNVRAGAFEDADKNAVKTSILGSSNSTATINADNKVTLTGSDLTGYPENLNLPDGAVTITWSSATPSVPSLNSPTGLDVTNITKLVYPAALYYRANSTIGVSATETVSSTYGEASWETISNTSSTTYYNWNGTVDGNTRSVALHDQIQYAVGRLDLKVAAANATLYDANGTSVTVDATNGFPISAVFIGGQKNVGYDFTPGSYTGTDNSSYTIYDNVMNGVIAAKVTPTDGGTNHTLVLETAASTLETGACKQVNVAVEMTNNTTSAFRGKDGTVPVGGKFYLVGVLNIETNKSAGDRTKIFEQDYITTANFTITQGKATAELAENEKNTTGLGAAYNVLPDLTISNLEVAFSVDLTWQAGLTFTVNM